MGKTEISSTVVGDKVIARLQELDHIAFIRFASVYRDFEDITELKSAVDTIVSNKSETAPVEQLTLLSQEELTAYKAKRRRGR